MSLRESFGSWVLCENCLTYMITTKDGNVAMANMFVRPNSFDIYDLKGRVVGSFDTRDEADLFMVDFCTVIDVDDEVKEAGA